MTEPANTVTQTTGKMTGYAATTPNGLTTGAGVAFVNYDLSSDTYASASAKRLGATSGGVSIKIEYPDAWDREIDGIPSNSKGMHECEFVKPTVTLTLVEVNSENAIKYGIGAATSEAATNPTGYKKITPDNIIEASDYLNNLTILTQSKTNPMIIVIKNPLSTEGFEFKTESKAGGGIEITFTGMYDPTDINASPIEFYTFTPTL